MTEPNLAVGRSEVRRPAGLTDGGHVYLSCSDCQALLMDLWVTRPHEDEAWLYSANCPWCGDKSFPVEVKGGIFPAGYGTPIPGDEDNVVPSTNYVDVEARGGRWHFKVEKASDDARPVYRRG